MAQSLLGKEDVGRDTASGLTSAEAAELLRKNGRNELAQKKSSGPMKIFLGQFRDFMVLILLAAAGVSVFLGEIYDAVTIGIIVFINAVLGFVQEYRTEKTLAALKNMTSPTARVYRDGSLREIPAAEVVVGDIISLEAGDCVPADAAVVRQKSLCCDESVLTGESVPVEKNAGRPDDTDNSIGRKNIVYSGCIVTKGTAAAKVIAVGTDAQMGKISGMLSEIEDEQTPLQKRLGELGKVIALICLGVCVVVSGAGILRGEPVFDMLMTGITIAIAAIPEGLPATVTIALALAVRRMLARNALVHKLHSVETLGCASVILTDKTGTITENKMTVCRMFDADGEYEVTGQGTRIKGDIVRSGVTADIASDSALAELLRCGVLCCNADIARDGDSWKCVGDPTEYAVLIAAAKGGMSHAAQRKAFLRTDEIPFDSDSRRMTVTVRTPDGGQRIYAKGAADVILGCCTKALTEEGEVRLTGKIRRQITEQWEKMSADALRVLAFASSEGNVSSGMTFLGLMGMTDPPRAEAKRAVRLCRDAHIRTVMITGDNPVTAAAVARQAGILREGEKVLTGAELAAMDDRALERAAGDTSVFAAVSPADKLRIVKAFRRLGHIAAMTGDGVNDAPSIKEADIGVAMGMTGTDVTKQAADMVLLDDNFATLVSAVEQGRGIYENIRKFVRYLLSCNIGEVLTMFLGIIMGMPVVLLPAQILLVNLVTDGLPAVALGVEPCDPDCMKAPPRRADESFFSGGLLFRICIRGVLIGVCTLGTFSLMLSMGAGLAAARTSALLTLVMSQLFHVFECKSEKKNIFTVPYLNNPKLILAVLFSAAVIFAAIYLPFLQIVFHTVPLTTEQVLTALGMAFAAPLIQCFVKI